MTELNLLLIRIRDGDSTCLPRAKELLAVDERLPADLREVGLDDDEPQFAAAALLGVLGLDDGMFADLLADALRDEAGSADTDLPAELRDAVTDDRPTEFAQFDDEEPSLVTFGFGRFGPQVEDSFDDLQVLVTTEMLAEQEGALPPVADAVRAEAGEVDVGVQVLRAMGVQVMDVGWAVRAESGSLDLSANLSASLGAVTVPVHSAVVAEAGGTDLAAEVIGQLGDPLLPVGEAVEHEAGDVDVVAAVLADVGLGVVDVRAAVFHEAGRVELSQAVLAQLGAAELGVGRAVRYLAGEVEVAAAVLSDLGVQAPDLAAAVRLEAGDADVAPAVLAELGHAGLQLAEAVRAEAGTTDVAAELSAALEPGWLSGLLDSELSSAGHRLAAGRLMRDQQATFEMTEHAALGRELREGISDEAGEAPYIWGAVASAIGIEAPELVEGYDGELVSEAVRSGAGPVDLAATVMARIQRSSVVEEPPEVPAPANNRWWQLPGLALVAVALIVVVAGQFLPRLGATPGAVNKDLGTDFASADEITVDDLSYGEEAYVQVIQTQEEDGEEALIIWIEEEV